MLGGCPHAWGLQGLSLSEAWVSAPREAQGEHQGARLAGPEQRGQGHTDRQAPPGQLEVRAGGSGGLEAPPQDPAQGHHHRGVCGRRVALLPQAHAGGPPAQLTVRRPSTAWAWEGYPWLTQGLAGELRCLTAQLDSYGGEWGRRPPRAAPQPPP